MNVPPPIERVGDHRRWLGALLIATGVARAAQLGGGDEVRWLVFAWPLLLLVAAIVLLVYREPEGVYEAHASAHGSAAHSH